MIVEKRPEELFGDVIGQWELKKTLAFHINNYQSSNILPHLSFIGPKGAGKTMVARQVARFLTKQGSKLPKTLVEVNASTLKSVKTFFDSVVIPFLTNADVTLFVDEASEIDRDVQICLLTILNPNSNNLTTYSYDNSVYTFDFKRISFIFATTDAQDLIDPLQDRLTPVDFEEYSKHDLIEILKHNLNKNKIEVDSEAISNAASILRGNPRSAQKMANSIKDYLIRRNKNKLSGDDWGDITRALSIKPLGLTATEIAILKTLKRNPNCSLTKLSAILGATREALQKHFELYLSKHELIEIGKGSGRNITLAGRKYLDDLEKMSLTF
jgi:Holliday junction resolvasome RuvABC ATP-dependent DNA helicase subunit